MEILGIFSNIKKIWVLDKIFWFIFCYEFQFEFYVFKLKYHELIDSNFECYLILLIEVNKQIQIKQVRITQFLVFNKWSVFLNFLSSFHNFLIFLLVIIFLLIDWSLIKVNESQKVIQTIHHNHIGQLNHKVTCSLKLLLILYVPV